MPKDTPAQLDTVLGQINKEYGQCIGTLSDVVDEVVGLTTGNLAIDYLTGIGGLPMGRITELYGQPSAGKTTTALQAAAALQAKIISENRVDDHILYLDFEHALDGEYAAGLGLDVDHPSFITVQPHWLEDGVDIAERVLRTGRVRVSIWDSVARMIPRDLEFGVRTHAMERARLMNSALQRLTSLLHENNCAGVFLNHLTEAVTMGGRPGMPPTETSPGGKALKFYASLRLAYKQTSVKKGQAYDALTGAPLEQVIATQVKVKCTKNKVGVPLREAEIRVRLGAGFDNTWTALQVLLAHKAVRKDGAWYRFDTDLDHPEMTLPATRGARRSIQGEAAVLDFADTHPDWGARLVDTARHLIDTHADTAIAPTPDDAFDLGTPVDVAAELENLT